MYQVVAFNRTIIELKLTSYTQQVSILPSSFNRTIIELKP